MLYNLDFEIASTIFLIIIGIYTVLQYGLREKVHRQFLMLVAITLIANVFDVVTAITISFHAAVPIWLNNVLNAIYFIADVAIGSSFLLYFQNVIIKESKNVLYWVNLITVSVYSLLIIISPLTHWIYFFTEEGYGKGGLYFIVFIGPFIFVFMTVAMIIKNHKTIGKLRLLSSMIYLTISVLGPLLQVLVLPDVLLSVFGASIGIVLVAFTMEYGKYEKAIEHTYELEVAKQEADKAREEAEAVNKDKDMFLARMSHEIRTPINAILGMNEMIQRESKDEAILAYATDVESSGKMLLSIINDILDLSKIEAGGMEIISVEYRLRNLLRDCYVVINPRAKEKGLELEVKVDPHLYDGLYGDEIRIRQILVNLLSNAVKYTEKGRITLVVSGKETEEAFLLSLSVKDTGHGIKPEDKEKLFASFKRIEEKRNRRVEGTGLGLSITKQLTDLMGGTLTVESVYELGSSFTVEIPQIVVDETPIGEIDFTAQNQSLSRVDRDALIVAPKAHILVVDDVKTNLKVIKGLLKQTQVQVDTATSGKECLALVKEKQYDVIFLDHMMPEMDGLETMEELKSMEGNLCIDTPIVMLTANAIQGAKEEYLEEGFAGYLAKPCKGRDIEEMLAKLLPSKLIEVRRIDI